MKHHNSACENSPQDIHKHEEKNLYQNLKCVHIRGLQQLLHELLRRVFVNVFSCQLREARRDARPTKPCKISQQCFPPDTVKPKGAAVQWSEGPQ